LGIWAKELRECLAQSYAVDRRRPRFRSRRSGEGEGQGEDQGRA
jgi:hypothetical protein